jgi:hypothetical protein
MPDAGIFTFSKPRVLHIFCNRKENSSWSIVLPLMFRDDPIDSVSADEAIVMRVRMLSFNGTFYLE